MTQFVTPSPTYQPQNEAQFRAQVQREDARNLKTDVAVPSFLMLDDDGVTVYRISLVSGVLTSTVVPA